MNEWRDIPNYEGLYQVNRIGQIKSLKTGELRSLQWDRNGYRNVRLYKDGKYYTEMVHRLVAEAFIPNPLNLPEINHINEVKHDNHVDNLEWCTREYNMNYGQVGENVSKALSKAILQFSSTGEFIKRWEGARIAARVLGVDSSSIIRAANGTRKTAYGCLWKYE